MGGVDSEGVGVLYILCGEKKRKGGLDDAKEKKKKKERKRGGEGCLLFKRKCHAGAPFALRIARICFFFQVTKRFRLVKVNGRQEREVRGNKAKIRTDKKTMSWSGEYISDLLRDDCHRARFDMQMCMSCACVLRGIFFNERVRRYEDEK